MTATTIDTLEFARKLRAGGVDERTANTIAQEVGHFVAENTTHPHALERIEQNMATKTGLAEVRSDIRWMKWGMGFIIAAIIGIVWQLIAVNRQLATIAAVVERIAQ
jgi:hypothetical protein